MGIKEEDPGVRSQQKNVLRNKGGPPCLFLCPCPPQPQANSPIPALLPLPSTQTQGQTGWADPESAGLDSLCPWHHPTYLAPLVIHSLPQLSKAEASSPDLLHHSPLCKNWTAYPMGRHSLHMVGTSQGDNSLLHLDTIFMCSCTRDQLRPQG